MKTLRNLVLALLIGLSLPLNAQEIHQKWVSSLNGALREFEFQKDSSLFFVRKIDILQPRAYYGDPDKMHYEILSQDEQHMRLLMEDLNTGEYSLVRLSDWSSKSMRMFVHPQLDSPEEAKAEFPPEAWGIRIYTKEGLEPIAKSKSPDLIQKEAYLEILDLAIQNIKPLALEEVSPTFAPMRPLYLSSRLFEAIADQGFNIFDTEALNKVMLNFLEIEEIDKRYGEFFKLATGKDWE